MFSFITGWFKKSKKKDGEEEEEEVNDLIAPKKKVYHRGDPIPYSSKFTGADRIVVKINDCKRDNVEEIEQHIFDSELIDRIIDLLEEFPKVGERQMDTNRCLEHTITAYKEDYPFAQMKLYDGHLMLEDRLFVGNNERLNFAEKQLFEIVEM